MPVYESLEILASHCKRPCVLEHLKGHMGRQQTQPVVQRAAKRYVPNQVPWLAPSCSTQLCHSALHIPFYSIGSYTIGQLDRGHSVRPAVPLAHPSRVEKGLAAGRHINMNAWSADTAVMKYRQTPCSPGHRWSHVELKPHFTCSVWAISGFRMALGRGASQLYESYTRWTTLDQKRWV